MAVNTERIQKLQRLGLNEQQARAYLALLDLPNATANELAGPSRVPRAKLYEVLEGLNKRGLVEIIPESPQRYRAAPMTAFFEHRRAELFAEEQDLKKTIGEVMVYLAQGRQEREVEGRSAPAQVSEGRTHYPTNLRRMVEATKLSLTVVGDRLVLPRLRLYEDILQSLALLSKKATVRILVPENAVDQVDGRRIHVDELTASLRRVPLAAGDACGVFRDHEEYMWARFVPNDLHPSRGTDRFILGMEPEIATMGQRLADLAWQAAPARA